MAHGSWKGNISFGLVNIPVTLHNAETFDKLEFHMLDKRNMSPIQYKKVNAETGKEVDSDDLVKGYEYRKGKYVLLTDDDFRKANIKATKTIEIQSFVDEGEIPITFFYKPYYVEPQERAEKSYAILRETLKRTHKTGVAKIVMQGHEHLCALTVRGDVLLVELLRFAHEIKQPNRKEIPPANYKKAGVKDSEIQMAEQLVAQMTDEWKPEQYKDTYQEDLKEFIKDKIKHGEAAEARNVEEPEESESKGKVVDFMDLLKRSVEHAGKNGSAKREPRSQRRSRASKSHSHHTGA